VLVEEEVDIESVLDVRCRAAHVHEHVREHVYVNVVVDVNVVVHVLVNVDGLSFNSLPLLSSLRAPAPRRQSF